jgi:hypothetical protein
VNGYSPTENISNLANNYFLEGWEENLVNQEIVTVNGFDALESSFIVMREDEPEAREIERHHVQAIGSEEAVHYLQFIRNGTLYTFYLYGANPRYLEMFRISFEFLK